MPTCWIIAGPNGAGKTTFAMEFLPEVAGCRRFINADLIAAGLSPLTPGAQQISASRLFLKEIQGAIREGHDFAFETTLSGKLHLKLIRDLREKGWEVELLYLALPNVELARSRVAERVLHGGHDIPEEAINRRFSRSLRNLFGEYGSAASRTRCFMNDEDRPKIVFERVGEECRIFREEEYRALKTRSSL